MPVEALGTLSISRPRVEALYMGSPGAGKSHAGRYGESTPLRQSAGGGRCHLLRIVSLRWLINPRPRLFGEGRTSFVFQDSFWQPLDTLDIEQGKPIPPGVPQTRDSVRKRTESVPQPKKPCIVSWQTRTIPAMNASLPQAPQLSYLRALGFRLVWGLLLSSNLSAQIERFTHFDEEVIEVGETDGSIEVFLTRTAGLSESLELELQFQNLSAQANVDYIAESLIRFEAGEAQTIAPIAIVDNATVDGQRSFRIALAPFNQPRARESGQSITIRIADDEQASLIDPDFELLWPEEPSQPLNPMAVLNDGRIIAQRPNGRGLLRFFPDGRWDPTFDYPFNPYISDFTEQYIEQVTEDAEGRLYVFGIRENFQQFISINPWVERLDAEGAPDSDFRRSALISAMDIPFVVHFLNSGDILVAGETLTETPEIFAEQARLARLRPDGSRDTSFQSDQVIPRDGGFIFALAEDPVGRILAGGAFSRFNGERINGMVRLDSNGVLDPSFDLQLPENTRIRAIETLADGSTIIAGRFDSAGGEPRSGILRLTSEGVIDPTFLGAGPYFDGEIQSIAADTEGGWLYLAGDFERYQGRARHGLLRVALENGALDPGFNGGESFRELSGPPLRLMKDGALLVGRHRVLTQPALDTAIQFHAETLEVEESGPSTALRIIRHGELTVPLEVQIQLEASVGSPESDIEPLPTHVTFDPGQQIQTLNIAPVDNGRVDGTRQMELSLRVSPSDDVLATSRVLILDDERPSIVDSVAWPALGQNSYFDTIVPLGFDLDGEDVALVIVRRDYPFFADIFGHYQQKRVHRVLPDGSQDEDFLFEPRTEDFGSFEASTLLANVGGLAFVAGSQEVESNGRWVPSLVAIDPMSGALEDSFDAPRWIQASGSYQPSLTALAAQPSSDGPRLLVGGDFRRVHTTTLRGLARLNLDGSVDESFDIGAGFDLENGEFHIAQILALPDGSGILVGGRFSTVDEQPIENFVRLGPDGAVDPEFSTELGAVWEFTSLAMESSGAWLVGGSFERWDRPIARVRPDGSIDRGFTPPAMDVAPDWIEVDPTDGAIYLFGSFTRVDDIPATGIAKIAPDGSLDFRYTLSAQRSGGRVMGRLSSNGDLFVSGLNQIEGSPANGYARLARPESWSEPRVFMRSTGFGSQNVFLGESDVPDRSNTPENRYTFRAFRSGTTIESLDAPVLATGTAQIGEDVSLDPPTFQFPPGQTESEIHLSVIDDGIVEPNESLHVSLEPGSGILQQGGISLSINDNETPSALDLGFRFELGHDDATRLIEPAPTGEAWYVAGDYEYGNPPRSAILVRILPDGSADPEFSVPESLTGRVDTLTVTPQRLYLGGYFNLDSFDDPVQALALLPDGSLDPTFDLGSGPDGDLRELELGAQGQIYLAGGFLEFDEKPQAYIARLNADGSLDTSFAPSPSRLGHVFQIGVLSDGSVIAAGSFPEVDGAPAPTVIRLLSDGSADPAFEFPYDGHVEQILVAPDDSIFLQGSFRLSETPYVEAQLVRLLPDGSLHPSFSPVTQLSIRGIRNLGDGSIGIAAYPATRDGIHTGHLTRISLDGAIQQTTSELIDSSIQSIHDFSWENPDKPIVVYSRSRVPRPLSSNLARLDLSDPHRTTYFIEPNSAWGSESNRAGGAIVHRVGDVDSTGSVELVLGSGTAESGVDFPSDQTIHLSFQPRQTRGTAHFAVVDDAIEEPEETFTVALSSSNPDLGFSSRTEQARLLDDDATASIDTSFSAHFVLRNDNGGNFGWNSEPVGLINPLGLEALDPELESVGEVRGVLPTPEGEILVHGSFSHVNGVERAGLARLHLDGSVDGSFHPGYTHPSIAHVALQSDGKVLVGYQQDAAPRLTRMDRQGAIDTTFQSLWAEDVASLGGVLVLPDYRILLWGSFTSVRGTTRNGVALLDADGALDPAMDVGSGPNRPIQDVALNSLGEVFIGGSFSRFGPERASFLGRLEMDGALHDNFLRSYRPNRDVGSIRPLPGGQMLLQGWFERLGSWRQDGIAVISNDGVPDPRFQSLQGSIDHVDIGVDDSWLASGRFDFDSQSHEGLYRFHSDGSLEPVLTQEEGLPLNTVGDIAISPDGDVFIAGGFDRFGDIRASGLVKWNQAFRFRIEGLERSVDGAIILTINSVPDMTFELLRSSNLQDWEPVDQQTATGFRLTLTDTEPDEVSYYQVRQAP